FPVPVSENPMAEVSMDGISNLSPELQRAFQSAVKAERRPLEAIENRKVAVEERVGLLNDIIGKVSHVQGMLPDLGNPIAIRDLAVATSDEHILTGTADKQLAAPGKHSLEVHQLARSATALSNRF